MAQSIKVGIIGGGWPGRAHARGYVASGGFKLEAVADLIPSRREQLMGEFKIPRQLGTWEEMLDDEAIDAVSVCVPNHLHAPVVLAALRKGKHVVCEHPPCLTASEAKRIESAAARAEKTLLYAFQRRFGAGEMAAKQAIAKGYAGNVYHARASWTRTRAVPIGTGWYTEKWKSGGGALIDLGLPMLDLAWSLMGEPSPASVFAGTHQQIAPPNSTEEGAKKFDVEESAFALIRFEGGQTLELSASWLINQSPAQNGVVCRVHGDQGAVEVYTAKGAVMHRGFAEAGQSKETVLKLPRMFGHGAMMRHFRECIVNNAPPACGPAQGLLLMQMIEAMYKSAEAGKSVQL